MNPTTHQNICRLLEKGWAIRTAGRVYGVSSAELCRSFPREWRKSYPATVRIKR